MIYNSYIYVFLYYMYAYILQFIGIGSLINVVCTSFSLVSFSPS